MKLLVKLSISKLLKELEVLLEKEGEELGEGEWFEEDVVVLEFLLDEVVEVEEVIEEFCVECIKCSGLWCVDDFKKVFFKEKMEKIKVCICENLEKMCFKIKENLEKMWYILEKCMNKLGMCLVFVEWCEKLKMLWDKLCKFFMFDYVVYVCFKIVVYKVLFFIFYVKKICEG